MAPIQFGILMVEYQMMDVAGPLDVLSSSSKGYISGIEQASGQTSSSIAEKGIEIEFHHIGETLEPVTLTGNFRSQPTTTIDTCPKLDYLLIGGTSLEYRLSPSFVKFLQKRIKDVKILFATCTGGFLLAQAGVIDGRHATTNHEVLPAVEKMYPQVKWAKRQWVVDGNLWTAGGACAGMDMFAHWVITNYGMDVAKIGFSALDYEPRDINAEKVRLS